jgi:4-hydroxybenzoate polyprenyltransferase
LKLLLTVSRPEFVPANSASLIIGLAWGLTLPVDVFLGLLAPLVLAFAVLSLVAAFAAHVNTMADYELDRKDGTKKGLVSAMGQLGKRKLKVVMVVEVALSLVFMGLLSFILGKPVLFLMWAAALFLAYAYSAEPLRFKSHSLLAMVTLLIVLSVLPVTFVTYVFTSTFDLAFVLFLSGQALTVYGVIVPAEIRDYFGDTAAGANTMTVRLGLVKASLLGLSLLSVGGMLCGIGFVLRLTSSSLPILSGFLLVMAAAYLYILSKYMKLYRLSKHLNASESRETTKQEIVDLAAKNPKWITIVTQTIVIMCIILLIAKII